MAKSKTIKKKSGREDAGFPACSTPSNLVLDVTADGFNVTWEGAATTYKIAYRKETDSAWVTDTLAGPGSSGGSGYNSDDTGGSLPSTTADTASFNVTGLTPGSYDLRMFNICEDGSAYERSMKFAISEDVGSIPNLQLQEDPGGNYQINIQWDAPTIDSGNPIIINWCNINEFGQKINCTAAEVDHDVAEYTILNPGPGLTEVWVAQLAENGMQYSVSEPLLVEGVPCGNNLCEFSPYVPVPDAV